MSFYESIKNIEQKLEEINDRILELENEKCDLYNRITQLETDLRKLKLKNQPEFYFII